MEENFDIEEVKPVKKKKLKWLAPTIAAVLGLTIGAGGMKIYDHIQYLRRTEDLYAKVATVQYILDNEYLYEYDESVLADYAALGMVIGLDDPYTMYYSAEEFSDYSDSGNGDFVGIGIIVTANYEQNVIQIESVIKGGPSEKAGIKAGDILFAVDGTEYSAMEYAEAIAKVRGMDEEGGSVGKSVNITVLRGGEKISFDIIREKVHTESVESKLLNDGIGYIKISEFNSSDGVNPDTYEEFKSHYNSLREQGAKKLVIDLRDNGGGDLDVVVNIIDMLVPKGNIMYSEDKHGRRDYIKSDSEETDLPIAVVVNGQSASASELMTGALKDYQKATVVGTKTYGKGVMQRVYPFTDGSAMVVTVAKYYTPNGTCVQDEGITPDIVIEPGEGEEDLQLNKAIEILSE